ncbi:MAG: Trm112 family protein [Thermoanaerobaculia bacterium]
MAVDPELLQILACPACDSRPPVQLCRLRDDVALGLIEKYREKIKDEEPVVTEGLHCAACGRVYAIVSDIPVMLVEEALPADSRI